MPYYGKMSLNIRQNLQKILKSAYPQLQFNYAFRSIKTIGMFF